VRTCTARCALLQMLLKLIFASHSTVVSNMGMDCKCCKYSLWLLVVATTAKSIFVMRNFEYVTNLAAVCPAHGSGGWYFGNSATKICRNANMCFVMYCPSVRNNANTAESISMKCDDLRGVPKLLAI